MDLTLLLRQCPLFADLSTTEIGGLREIAARKQYRRGELIFLEGEPSRGFYLVVSGAVKIYRTTPDGRERVLHVVEAGEAFAEAALFMEAFPANAEAVLPTTVLFLEKNGFKRLLAQNPHLSFKIIGALVRWLRQMRDALTDLTLKEVPARFAGYVLSLPATPGQPIAMRIRKTTVAQILGTTKETFSRLLAKLAKRRILMYRGNQIKILDRPRLEALAEGRERL